MSSNLLTKLSLNLRILRNKIYHHLREIRSCVCSCIEKCCELVIYLFKRLNYLLFLGTLSFLHNQCLNYILRLIFPIFTLQLTLNLFDPLTQITINPILIQLNSLNNIPIFGPQSQFHKFLTKQKTDRIKTILTTVIN